MRGLGELLRYACQSLPCGESLIALEDDALGRMIVPVVASAEESRAVALEIVAEGTPIAHALAGGSGQAMELVPEDAAIAPLLPALATTPTSGIFVPVKVGDREVGALVLLASDRPLGEAELEMAERLGEVAGLVVDAFFAERMLFDLFARSLPDVLGPDAATSLPQRLTEHLHTIRCAPHHRRATELALSVGRLAFRSEAESHLVETVLEAFERYVRTLEGSA